MADPAVERKGGDLLSDLKDLMRSKDGAVRLRAAFSGVVEISLDAFRAGLAKPDLGLPALPGDATTKELFDMLDILGSGTIISDELFESLAPHPALAENLAVDTPADTPAAVINPASEPATPAASDGDTTAAATPSAAAPPTEDAAPPPAVAQPAAPEAQIAEVTSAPVSITDGPAAAASEPPSAPATAQEPSAPAAAQQEPSAPASSVPQQAAASATPAPPSAAALDALASAADGAGGVAAGGAATGGVELMKQDGNVDVSVTERSMAALQEVLRNKSDRCGAYTDGCPRICSSVHTDSLMMRFKQTPAPSESNMLSG